MWKYDIVDFKWLRGRGGGALFSKKRIRKWFDKFHLNMKIAESSLMWGALACLNKFCFLLFFSNVVCSFMDRVRSPWLTLLLPPGDRDEAISVLMAAKKYIPNESTLYFNLGNMLGQKEEFQVRMFWWRICLKLEVITKSDLERPPSKNETFFISCACDCLVKI